MPEKKFELGDYVEVKDRIRILYELFPQARIETDYHLTAEPDGKPKVISRALVYRKPDDERPAAHGTSWLYLPGKTPYTNGSEIENAETSAVGRAIGMLGILIAGGLASKQEIDNKAGSDQERPVARAGGLVGTEAHPVPEITADGGLIGTAITEGKYDFGLRQTPDGWRLPFRVKNGAKSFIVIAEDGLAEVLAPLASEVIGSRVTVWGHWTDETLPAKGTKPEIHYRILHLERIATSEWTLPILEALPPPIFDESDLAALDNELAGEGLGLSA